MGHRTQCAKRLLTRLIIYCVCFFIIIILLFVLFSFICYKFSPTFFALLPHQVSVTDKPIVIMENGYHPANNRQFSTDVTMTVFNNKLYFYMNKDRSAYNKYLCVFENGIVNRVEKIEGRITGISNGFVYYETDAEEHQKTAYVYDIGADQHTVLATIQGSDLRDYYISKEGVFNIPLDKSRSFYYPIIRDQIGEATDQQESYTIGSKKYVLESNIAETELVCYDEKNLRQVLELPYGYRSLILCDKGLLIHNEGFANPLYLIEKDTGKCIELFTIPCLVSHSAVNVHDSYVYLSFKRYEKHGELGLRRYENDTLEGTYRISLLDYSVSKISDDIYNGLYIFDDTGIYACNEDGSIYMLDFNGNRILTLME